MKKQFISPTALRYSMQETLENWFASNSLEVKAIGICKDGEGKFEYAVGEFHPVLFDKEADGPKLRVLFQLEIALVDERFENTELFFETGLKFSIQ
jgi:hypothetical protein